MINSSSDWEPVRYCVDTDTMAIQLRPWPGQPGETGEGEDAGLDLVIHYYPGDGKPWLWEIEHASEHPEHIAAALSEIRSGQSKRHTIKDFPTLRRGASGEAVKELQRLLGVKDDGIFGLTTEAAVRNKQIAAGIVVDGIVGPHTWAVLGANAAYFRKVAAEIRDLARMAQQPEVRSEMTDLAERFERMAAYVEKRFPTEVT